MFKKTRTLKICEIRPRIGCPMLALIVLFAVLIIWPNLASASAVNYHGRILRPDGTPVQNLSVEFKIQIRTPGLENCLMYEETLSAPVVNGLFSIAIGTNTRTDSFSTWNFDRVFSNRSTFNLTAPDCTMTSDYAPTPGDGRMISVYFRESPLGTFEAMPRQALNYAPMAIESRFVSGYGSGSLLKIEGVDNRTTLSGAQLTELVALTNGNYVRSSGATGAVVPVLSGNASGAVAGSIWYDSSANQLKYSDGTTAQVVGSASGGAGGISSINGLTALTQTFATIGSSGSSPNWASSGSAHTLNIPLAASSGVSAGLISTAQYDSFNAKLGSTLNSGQIFVGNTGNVATAVTPTGDLALAGDGATTLTAIRGQAVDATVPVEGQVFRWTTSTKWTPAFLSMADVRSTAIPGNTIFPTTSCTTGQTLNWSSLTDTFVCNSIAITGAQVNYGSALTAGTVFAAPAGSTGAPSFRALVASDLPAGVSSQWTTNGANIFYGTGNVGIGTTAPGVNLEIGGTTGLRSRGKLAVDFGSATSSAYIELTGRNAGSANVTHMYANPQGDLVLQSNVARAVTLGTNTTEFMRVDGNGNVGIGTTLPTGALDVRAGSAAASTNGTNISLFAQSAGTGNQAGGNLILMPGSRSGTGAWGGVSVGNSTPPTYLAQNSLYVEGTIYANGMVNAQNGIQFADGSMGIFSTGNGTSGYVDFSQNFIPRLRIASNGSIGIGTATPAGILDLWGTTTGNSALVLPRSTTALRPSAPVNGMIRYNTDLSAMEIYGSGAWSSVATGSGGSAPWTTSGSNAIFALSGSVGIGTNAPSAMLQVAGSGATPISFEVMQNGGSGTPIVGITGFGGSAPLLQMSQARGANIAPSPTQAFDTLGVIQAQGFGGTSTYGGPTIQFHAEANFTTASLPSAITFQTIPSGSTGVVERMRIAGNGRVGIGTNNPTDALTVRSTTGETFVHARSGANAAGFQATSDSGANTYNSFYSGGASSGSRQKYFGNMNGALQFGRSDDAWSSNVAQMTILNNGNVGIGTTNPGGLLSLATTTTPNIFVQESTTGGSQIFQASYGSFNQMIQMRSNAGYSAVNADEQIGGFEYRAVDTNFTQRIPATFEAYADGPATNGSVPGRLIFSTAPSGSGTALERLRITSLGNVGIGSTSPAYKLDVTGDINASANVRAAGVVLTSDVRFKRNIQVLDGSLAKILRLRGVRYAWRTEEFPSRQFTHRDQVGVIAQEVEVEFPELVDTAADGFKAVNYPALVSPLIESTKELYGLCRDQSEKITHLENDLRDVKELAVKLSRENEDLKARFERLEKRLLQKSSLDPQ